MGGWRSRRMMEEDWRRICEAQKDGIKALMEIVRLQGKAIKVLAKALDDKWRGR